MSKIAIILPPVCSCNRPLGRLQYDFESLTASGVSMVDACTQLGLNLMCCRNQVLNSSLYFIQSQNIERVCDRVGLTKPLDRGLDNVYNTPDIPYTRKPPSYPALPGSYEFREEVPAIIYPAQGQMIPSLADYLATLPNLISSPPQDNFFGEN